MAPRSARKLTREETAALASATGVSHPRVLAVARGPEAVVVLLPDRLVVRRPNGWEMVAWEDIQRGGFDGDTSVLSWELTDQSRSQVSIDDPVRVPRAFQELIGSSILVARRVRLADDLGTVVITGRRSPTGHGPVSWQTEAMGRCNLADPRVQSQILDLVTEARAEFE